MSFFEPRPRPEPTILPVPPQAIGFRLRIELNDSFPPVWRSIEVPGDVSLDTFHLLVQSAMGWENSHLHQFFQGRDLSGPNFLTDFDLAEGEIGISEAEVQVSQVLAEPGDVLGYLYDFGDDWYHTITVEGVLPEVPELPRVVDGQRACPPEDIGGVHVFEEVSAWVRAGSPDNVEAGYIEPDVLREWLEPGWHPDIFAVETKTEMHHVLADPIPIAAELRELFDGVPGRGGEFAEELLHRTTSSEHMSEESLIPREMLAPFITFLEVIGDGVKLTAAKRLPPAVVKQYAQASGISDWWIHGITTEANVRPVAEVHEIARSLGLVYTRKGKVLSTLKARKLGEEPAAWMDHLATKLPLGRGDFDRHAGWMTLLVAGADEESEEWMTLIKVALADLGWRTTINQIQTAPNPYNPTLTLLKLLVDGLEGTYKSHSQHLLSSAELEDNRRAVATLARRVVLTGKEE